MGVSLDDEIYQDFRQTFANLNIETLDVEQFKSTLAKEQWRTWIMKYEKKISDYNFGTLLRLKSDEPYHEDNAFFGTLFCNLIVVTRTQFCAIEIARNRENLNSVHLNKRYD